MNGGIFDCDPPKSCYKFFFPAESELVLQRSLLGDIMELAFHEYEAMYSLHSSRLPEQQMHTFSFTPREKNSFLNGHKFTAAILYYPEYLDEDAPRELREARPGIDRKQRPSAVLSILLPVDAPMRASLEALAETYVKGVLPKAEKDVPLN